jgi:hypothetical protein
MSNNGLSPRDTLWTCWAPMVVYGPFSLCVPVYKEGLCPSSGEVNTIMIYYYNSITANYGAHVTFSTKKIQEEF